MPLVFSPLTESLLDSPLKKLLPKHAFVMRQIGSPLMTDVEIFETLKGKFSKRGITSIDADATTGSKDFLGRILELIRSTGFTVAIFSHETRSGSMANIALELGFAAMCGKPIIIVKSREAAAPSDLKRTDWIEYDASDATGFDRKLDQAIDVINDLGEMEATLLEVAMEANCPDCAVALEHCSKGFLLSGNKKFITVAERVLECLNKVQEQAQIADLERQRAEVRTFIRQATKALGSTLRHRR